MYVEDNFSVTRYREPNTSSQLLRKTIVAALRTVEDPEIPLNIVDMGLIYGISITRGAVDISMTLTAVGCPAGAMLREDIQERVSRLPDIDNVTINLVWEPPWTSRFLSDEGRCQLLALGIATPEPH